PTEHSHLSRPRFLAIDPDALLPTSQYFFVNDLLDLGRINLGSIAACVRQRLGEVAIVGEKQGTASVEIKASDRDYAQPHLSKDVPGCGASLGIGERRHHSARLVQNSVAQRLWLYPSAIHLNGRLLGVCFGSKLRDHSPIDTHASRRNEALCFAAGTQARSGEDFLKSFFGHFHLPVTPRSSLGGGVRGVWRRSLPLTSFFVVFLGASPGSLGVTTPNVDRSIEICIQSHSHQPLVFVILENIRLSIIVGIALH